MVVKGKLPTFAVASVRLLRVVDLPLLGLPTRAIRGSRGIVGSPYTEVCSQSIPVTHLEDETVMKRS